MKVSDDLRFALYRDLVSVVEATGIHVNDYLEEKVGELVEAIVEALENEPEENNDGI